MEDRGVDTTDLESSKNAFLEVAQISCKSDEALRKSDEALRKGGVLNLHKWNFSGKRNYVIDTS